jgi:CheY-like chemotaxis protein
LEIVKRGSRLDLIVSDHLMPGMTGAELAEIVRARRPEMPIVLASGFAELPDVDGQLTRLAKPFTQAELARAIDLARAH